MSLDATRWVWRLTGITPIEKLILLCLADHHNEEHNQCNPKIKTIAMECEISYKTVVRAMQRLKKIGVIKAEAKKLTGGRRTSNQYNLQIGHCGGEVPGLSGGEVPPHAGGDLNLHSESEFESSDSEAETNVSAVDIGWDKTSDGILVGEEENFEKEEFMKVDDVYKEACEKTLTVESALLKARKGKESYTTMRLSALWRDLNLVFNPGVFQKAFSMKNLGQFSHIAKTEGVDLGDVMVSAVRDWMGFGKYLKGQGLVFDFPDSPNIGFFLKHFEGAARFSKKNLEPSTAIKMKHTTVGA